MLKLIPADIGRPISDLSLNFEGYDLTTDARVVFWGAAVIERDVRHVDGADYVLRILPYRTQADRVDGIVVTFDDVTRLRRAEERTRRLATVVADSNDAIVLLDTNGNIQAWNRGAQGLYGWSEAEALRMNVRDLVPAGGTDELSAAIPRLVAGEVVPSFETHRRTKNGRVREVLATVSAVRDESKGVVALAATERDITERKRTEDEIQQRIEEQRAANEELARFNRAAVDRELRMIELKKQVNELCAKLGEPDRYKVDLGEEDTSR